MNEITFAARSLTTLPQDHGYPLLAALSQVCPNLHGREDVQVAPIGGNWVQDRIQLRGNSCLRLRGVAPSEVSTLEGSTLMLENIPLFLGQMLVKNFRPAPLLCSRLTIYSEILDPESFRERLLSQVQSLTDSEPEITLGRRRAFRFKTSSFLGYSVTLNNLTPEASLRIQRHGLGKFTSMGCGVYHRAPK